MINGYASIQDTKHYLENYNIVKRESPWFLASPIAIGTHLGEMSVEDSTLYRKSIAFVLQNGINFIDTALNYRGMRSERDIGHILTELIQNKKVLQREELVISTKAGIIPGDIEANLVPNDYLKYILYQKDIIKPSDLHIVGTVRHVLAPSYFEFAIEQSRKHFNLNTIDIHYIHNPEWSMNYLGPDLFYKKLHDLFVFYEDQVEKGTIRFYGMATWNAFLYEPHKPDYISLEKVIEIAESVAGNQHHFKFIQLPYNYNRTDANTKQNQVVKGRMLSAFQAAKELNIYITTSAPFDAGKAILNNKEDPFKLLSDIIKTEGIFSTMIGMKQIQHVKRNLIVIEQIPTDNKQLC